MRMVVDRPVHSLMTFSLLGFQAAAPPLVCGGRGVTQLKGTSGQVSEHRALCMGGKGGLKDICAPPAQPWELQQPPHPLCLS